MAKQKIFNFHLKDDYSFENFFVSSSNSYTYNQLFNNNYTQKNIIIKGPAKSGKTHLGLIWKKYNNALQYNNKNYRSILNQKKNVFYDDLFFDLNEEYLFYIVNHCLNNKLKILISTNKLLSEHIFKIKDLSSRLKSFYFVEIKEPDDELLNHLLMKLLLDKQIIIKSDEIFSYIAKRINRTYFDIYKFVEKVDKLSLQKKRQLTIPLIKELL